MAATIVRDPNGDTPATIEDKVRALPQNQGLNEIVMLALVVAEIAQSLADGLLRNNEAL